MLQRSPTYIASVPAAKPAVQRPAPGAARRAGPAPARGGCWRSATQAFYQLSQRRPKLVKKLLRKGLERQLPDGLRHRHPLHAELQPVGPAAVRGARRRPLQGHRRRARLGRHRPHRHVHRDRACGSSRATSSRPTSSSPPPGSRCCSSAASTLTVDGEPVDLPSLLTYKGMMLEGVPNLALAFGYTNASWTLKCDLTCDYVCRLLNHLHETGLRQCTPRQPRRRRSPPSPMLGLSSGYIQRAVDRFPKQGSKFPWQVHQSYLRDYRALKMSDIEDDVMVFSNPARPRPGSPCPPPAEGARPREGLQRPGGRHHRSRLGHRPGPRRRPGRARRAPGALRHRRGRPGRDGRRCARAAASRSPRSASTWPTAPRSRPGPTQVVDDHGKVNLIFNNAGVALGGHRRGDVLRRLRLVDGHQLLGRRARHQGLPAAPQGLGRGPRRQHLERLRPGQHPGAVGLQRRQVRGARLHRRAAHGARDRGCAGVGHHHPPRWHQDQHRPQRPHRREHVRRRRRRRRHARRVRQDRHDHAREGGPADPRRRRAATAGVPSSGPTPRCSTSCRACRPASTSGPSCRAPSAAADAHARPLASSTGERPRVVEGSVPPWLPTRSPSPTRPTH